MTRLLQLTITYKGFPFKDNAPFFRLLTYLNNHKWRLKKNGLKLMINNKDVLTLISPYINLSRAGS